MGRKIPSPMLKYLALLFAFTLLALPSLLSPGKPKATGAAVIAGIAAHRIEAPTFAGIRVTAQSVLTTNTVLTVIPGEFLPRIEPPKHSPPKKPNGG